MIDGRKSTQDFINPSSGKRIYCHKAKDGRYTMGINGTEHHSSASDKYSAEAEVRKLKAVYISRY